MRWGTSPNPLTREHWLGTVDPRPFDLFRIALGLVLLTDLPLRAADYRAFYTDEGILPRGMQGLPWAWSIFDLSGANLPVLLLFLAGTLATLAFTVGYETRWATVATWVFTMSLHNRNRGLSLGGDDLAAVLLFWSMFSELGASYSLDARRLGTKKEILALGPRLLAYTPAVIYLHAARFKLFYAAKGWLHGPIIYQHMQQLGWIRLAGPWVGQHPFLCSLIGDATIVIEFSIPLLVVSPWFVRPSRALAVLLNFGLQFGIGLTMKVGIFTGVMLAIGFLWLEPVWIDRFVARFPKLRLPVSLTGPERPARLEITPWTRPRAVLAGVVFLQFVIMAITPPLWRRMPRWSTASLPWLGLELRVSLFSRVELIDRLEVNGTLVDGTHVAVLLVVAPGAIGDTRFAFSPWAPLPNRDAHWDAVARYFCREYNTPARGPRLLAMDFVRYRHMPAAPYAPPDPEHVEALWSGACAPE